MSEVMLRKGAKTEAAVEMLGINADDKAEMNVRRRHAVAWARNAIDRTADQGRSDP